MCQLVIKDNSDDRTLQCTAVFQGHAMEVNQEVLGEIAGMVYLMDQETTESEKCWSLIG